MHLGRKRVSITGERDQGRLPSGRLFTFGTLVTFAVIVPVVLIVIVIVTRDLQLSREKAVRVWLAG